MISEPRCSVRKCKWLSGVSELTKGQEDTQVPVCPAFPREIPEDIAWGENPHSHVQQDQLGSFVYEKVQSNV